MMKNNLALRRTILLACALGLTAACGSSDASDTDSSDAPPVATAGGESEAEISTTDAPVPEPTAAPAAPAADGGWTVVIGEASYAVPADGAVCLTLPGDTFVLNASGATESGAAFEFYLSNEPEPEFNFEVAGNKTVGVSTSLGNDIAIEYDGDSGTVTADGAAQNGVPFVVSGSC